VAQIDDIGRLQEKIDRLAEVRGTARFGFTFTKWRQDTEIAIRKIFKGDPSHIDSFTAITYDLTLSSGLNPKEEESLCQRAYDKGLDQAEAVLMSFINEIKEYPTKEVPQEELQPPNTFTIHWAFDHVPLKFWAWFAGLLIAAFIFGVAVGQITLVREIFSVFHPPTTIVDKSRNRDAPLPKTETNPNQPKAIEPPQKDKKITMLSRERDKLGDNVQNQKEQLTLKGKLTDSPAEVTKSQTRVPTLEQENRQPQVEGKEEDLKNKATSPQVSFQLVGGKLFLLEGDKKREIFTPTYSIVEYSQSKSGKKFATILVQRYNYFITVCNADHDLSYPSLWRIDGPHYSYPPKNLKWVSDTVFRLYLNGEYGILKLDDIVLKGTGNYEFTIDEINSFVGYKKLNIGG
jgi:hypothetical protein